MSGTVKGENAAVAVEEAGTAGEEIEEMIEIETMVEEGLTTEGLAILDLHVDMIQETEGRFGALLRDRQIHTFRIAVVGADETREGGLLFPSHLCLPIQTLVLALHLLADGIGHRQDPARQPHVGADQGLQICVAARIGTEEAVDEDGVLIAGIVEDHLHFLYLVPALDLHEHPNEDDQPLRTR
jgi:hypothetical protein